MPILRSDIRVWILLHVYLKFFIDTLSNITFNLHCYKHFNELFFYMSFQSRVNTNTQAPMPLHTVTLLHYYKDVTWWYCDESKCVFVRARHLCDVRRQSTLTYDNWRCSSHRPAPPDVSGEAAQILVWIPRVAEKLLIIMS